MAKCLSVTCLVKFLTKEWNVNLLQLKDIRLLKLPDSTKAAQSLEVNQANCENVCWYIQRTSNKKLSGSLSNLMLREQGMGATCIHSLGLLYCVQIRIRGLSFTILGGERYFLLWGYISVVKFFFLKQVCTLLGCMPLWGVYYFL